MGILRTTSFRANGWAAGGHRPRHLMQGKEKSFTCMTRCISPFRPSLLELVIPPTNRLGSSVGERPACIGKVPGSIPGLAYSFLFLHPLQVRSFTRTVHTRIP